MKDIQRRKNDISLLTHTAYIISFSILLVIAVSMQCSGITVFGIVPDIAFALVCAIGFISKEKYGAVFGLIGGVLIMYMGSVGVSMSPVMYTICAYLCGVMPSLILRRNFLSYTVFTLIMGAIHIFFSLIYIILFSSSFEIWKVVGENMIPEFFSCIILMIAAYGIVKLINTLFKGKKKGMRV